MALPKSIQKQADKAKEISDQLSNPSPPPAAEAPQDPVPPEPPSPPQPAADPAPAPQVEADWEQRYRTLQGKYDSQVPQLQRQVQELTSQLTHLTSKLEGLTAKPEPAPEPTAPLVTDKDVEVYGADLVDLVKRQAMQVAQEMTREMTGKLTALEQENQQLRDQLGGVSSQQVQTREQSYLAALTQIVPDWSEINQDPAFIQWLTVVDDLSGVPRQAYLDSAYQAKDVQRTATIFSSFKQTQSPAQQPAPPAPTPLERQVAPSTSRATAPEPTPGAADKVWTRDEVTRFYTDVRTGKYRGREADAARIDAEITAAAATGRVKT